VLIAGERGLLDGSLLGLYTTFCILLINREAKEDEKQKAPFTVRDRDGEATLIQGLYSFDILCSL
jgi:hypothetical protein